MNNYVVRYAHLEKINVLNGDIIKRGDTLGVIGGTPYNNDGEYYYGVHLHIDCREAINDNGIGTTDLWRLSQTPKMKSINEKTKQQLDYFIDDELFNAPIKITTKYLCPYYEQEVGVQHPAYDCYAMGNYTLLWNRSMNGKVVKVGHDCPNGKGGYGHYILIEFKA